jgi:SAM-dependent methyltransferase
MPQGVIYDSIGSGYNTTRRADPHIVGRLYELLSPQTDGVYLDVGCGTGNYTTALSEKNIQIYGVDPSLHMLAVARERSRVINWFEGTVESLPFDSGFFSGIIATLTIHHWSDLKQGFAELYRVLKKGGRFVLFTAYPGQMSGYWLNHYFPGMMAQSIAQMPDADIVTGALEEAGFTLMQTEPYAIKDDLQDHFLYVGKNRPELYLIDQVRSGISSFAALAHADEVKRGLAELKYDLDTGRFNQVTAAFENEGGDYIFVVAEKY